MLVEKFLWNNTYYTRKELRAMGKTRMIPGENKIRVEMENNYVLILPSLMIERSKRSI